MDLVNTEDGTDKSKENAALGQGIRSVVLAAIYVAQCGHKSQVNEWAFKILK
jgi:hypothetical protein